MHHAANIADGDVFALEAHGDQQIKAGQGRRAAAGIDQAHIFQALALQQKPIADGGGNDDCRAVLVIMKDRDAHAFAQAAFHFKAFRRLDVFKVDGAEGGFQRGNHLDQLVGVAFVNFDVYRINAGEFLEQNRLAFHDGLGRQRADGAKAQHRRAIGNHRDQIAARGIVEGGAWVGGYGLTRGSNTGRIGQAKVALGFHPLGRRDGKLPGAGQPVVIQRGFTEIIIHEGYLTRQHPKG